MSTPIKELVDVYANKRWIKRADAKKLSPLIEKLEEKYGQTLTDFSSDYVEGSQNKDLTTIISDASLTHFITSEEFGLLVRFQMKIRSQAQAVLEKSRASGAPGSMVRGIAQE